MKLRTLALAGCFVMVGAGAQTPSSTPPGGMPPAQTAPHGAGAKAPGMGLTPSSAQRIVWSCQVGQLGTLPVMVNFVDRTALSTRAGAIGQATIDGDKVRWQEAEPDGTLKYLLDRRTGEIQVTQTPGKGKEIVHRGKCAPPVKKGAKQQ